MIATTSNQDSHCREDLVDSEQSDDDGYDITLKKLLFFHLRQYHPTPSPINNPDTDSYHDTFCQFFPKTDQSSFDPLQTQIFTKDVSNDSIT